MENSKILRQVDTFSVFTLFAHQGRAYAVLLCKVTVKLPGCLLGN